MQGTRPVLRGGVGVFPLFEEGADSQAIASVPGELEAFHCSVHRMAQRKSCQLPPHSPFGRLTALSNVEGLRSCRPPLQRGGNDSQRLRALALLIVAACLWLSPVLGEDLPSLDDDAFTKEDAAAMLGETTTRDLDLVRISHLSMLPAWEGVQQEGKSGHWVAERDFVRPQDEGAISTLIDVPEAATYHIYLRHRLSAKNPVPVTLTLTPQAGGGEALTHIFGQVTIGGGLTGKQLEKKLPVRFESEAQSIGIQNDAAVAWERWSVELKKGVYSAALAKGNDQIRASALFLTRSKDFRPSLATSQECTFGRVYMRFRAMDAKAQKGAKFAVDASLGYHWGRGVPNSTQPVWGWKIGTTPATPVQEWSPFVEATEAIVPGPGPWSTCHIQVGGMQDGELEVQFAWFTHAKAVALSVKTSVGAGRALLRVPHGDWRSVPKAGVPAWGVWNPEPLKQILTQEAVIERYFTWATDAAKKLGLKEDHPRPKYIRIFSGCGVLPSARERAAEMLAKLGVNWIDGAPESVVKKYGLYDERCAYNTADPEGLAHGMSPADRAKLTKVKIGDEIGTYTQPASVNADAGMRSTFHKYLAEQAKLNGMDIPTFLGVQDVSDLPCIGGPLPADAGRFQHRLFYHSQRFCHLITCDYYRDITARFQKFFRNVHVYNNYSPHPVFLTGATMNESDWFMLPRHETQTLGWAEDWATGGGWGLDTAYQCTSFYSALVDCAVRKHGYPAGFYVGTNCGGSAEKIFSCVGQGLTWLHLYDWGPVDSWADGSNAWSEHEGEYGAILRATHAIGPADEIIGKGRREPRRTAILYNRSHEIMHGGAGRLNHDWMWTYIGLKSSQIPVDVIIEEDLNPTDLKRYDCVFLGGFNLSKAHLAELKRWVEAGGLLVGTGGAAMYDVYDEPLAETVELFGARQRIALAKDEATLGKVTFPASDYFPAIELAPGGMKFVLEPTSGKSLGTYGNSACAAVTNVVSKGRTILLGFHPGHTYYANGKAAGKARAWLAAPVLKRLGRQRVEFSHPASEATLFEHESGLAVMLACYGGPSPEGGSTLSVQTARDVKDVQSSLHGRLEWKRTGDRIEIKTARVEPVDVVILK